jgi:hypothetical protein
MRSSTRAIYPSRLRSVDSHLARWGLFRIHARLAAHVISLTISNARIMLVPVRLEVPWAGQRSAVESIAPPTRLLESDHLLFVSSLSEFISKRPREGKIA